jgi:5'-3' exoribonuclease 2
MCQSYLDGLCWVLNYYFQGPPSWEWFYPFHYAPCASDLYASVAALSASAPYLTYRVDFSSPLKPVEQLLSVLPAESAHALPLACQGLMTSPSSPLVDVFHPKEISIDRCNAMSWLWILLLPFVDVNRITKASKECEPHFTAAETARNSYGTAFLYVNSLQCTSTKLPPATATAVAASAASPNEATERDDLRDCLSPTEESQEVVVYPLYGFVSHAPVEDSSSEDEEGEEEEAEQILCFRYFLPTETIHRSALIAGVLPLNSPLDLRVRNKKWRGRGGGRGRGRGGSRGRGRSGREGGGRGRGGAAAEEHVPGHVHAKHRKGK